MPSWGRPPGAKGSRQRKRWEREKALWEQEQIRIEEIDSDDSDTQGVGLAYGEKRFVSDPLKFTGIDLSPKQGARRGYRFDGSESDSDGSRSRSDDEDNMSERQIALRDKEEALVQSALARIRRAQERGKREVKLNPEEVAALERRRKRMQSSATSKPRKGSASSGGSGNEKKRRSDRALVTIPIVSPEPRRPSDKHRDYSPLRNSPGGPGMVVEGADGVLSYAPIGQYPPAARSSPIRPRSSTSLSQGPQHTPPPYLSDHPQARHYSDEIRPTSSGANPRLPLPHEEGWEPSSRRSSVSSQGYSRDPFDYQTSSGYPPSLSAGYMQASGRRNVSGPPQVSYSSVRRSPPVGTTSSSSKMRYNVAASSSDPNLHRRRAEDEVPDSQDSRSSSDEDDDESDDLGNGVSVEPERPSTSSSRKPVGGHGHGRKKGKR
jgi:PRA1 family protein 1